MSSKSIESEIMDQTKSQKNERLKQAIVSLRQQMLEMYRAWASGMPSLPFSTIDPTSTLSFSPKLQGRFSVVGYVPQHASESIPSQKNLNVSITHSLDLQYKSSTSITPPIVSASVAPSSIEVSTLVFSPTIVPPQSASKSMFNILDDYYYTPEPTSMLVGPSKFLTKKSDMTEEQEKMARKMNSTEKATKNSKGIVNYKDVAYRYRDMSSSVNLSPSLEISKFEKHDGAKQSSRGPTQQYCQFQSRACTSNSYAHMQQGSSLQNPRYFIPLPQYTLNNTQLYAHSFSYPQWNTPTPQSYPSIPQIYQPPSRPNFRSKTNNEMRQIYQSPSRPNFRSKTNNEMRQKLRDCFTPIGESYASLFQRLVHEGMITPLLGHIINFHSRNFDPNARCPYHSDARGHSIEDYRALKREIERMI
ncbi:hypothetical protein P3S67_009289 [Capsicum chacoense]